MRGPRRLLTAAAAHLIPLSASGAAHHHLPSAAGAGRALPGLGGLLRPPTAEGQAWLGTETVLARGVVHPQRAGSGGLFVCRPLILSQAAPSLSLRWKNKRETEGNGGKNVSP